MMSTARRFARGGLVSLLVVPDALELGAEQLFALELRELSLVRDAEAHVADETS